MNKRLVKILMAGVSPAFVLMLGGPAFAQSTGTQAVEGIESVTVTGEHEITGIMKPITVPKERSTIDQDFINTQPAGQRSEERRVGKECRSRCDWSSDVCSSDLRHRRA